MSAPAHAEHAAGVPSRDAGGLLRQAVLAAIRLYQLVVSPWLPPACRFEPSCSHYASQAVSQHGVVRGLWLGLRRLVRCHPLGGHGYDPVP